MGKIHSFYLSKARKGTLNVGFDSTFLGFHSEASKLKVQAMALMMEYDGFEVKLFRSIAKQSELC